MRLDTPEPIRILIFHIRISMGHERAAQALAEAFRRRHPDAQVRLVEAIGYSAGWLAPVVCQSYLSIIKHIPALWDFLYDSPRAEWAADPVLNRWTRKARKNFLALMAEFRPHAVVCTQALPARILARLKDWGDDSKPGMNAPVYAVATDFSIHRYWAADRIDGYFLPGAAEFEKLISMGVPREKIFCSGIPIHPHIADAVPDAAIAAARTRYGLRPGFPTVLLMGGSRGVGLRKKLIHAMEQLPDSMNILAMAGTNPVLLDVFQSWAASSRHHVIPLQYIDDIRILYEVSDLAVTKPGGLTLAEAMSVGLPMVIPYALPGQERHNLEFVKSHSLAEIADTPAAVADRVLSILRNPARRAEFAMRLKAYSRPNAAFEIVDRILSASSHRDAVRPPALPLFSGL